MREASGIKADEFALFTDLYQLTMAQSYFDHHCFNTATFSLFIRDYPVRYGYFVAAGLATVLEYLEQIHFSQSALSYLKSSGRFRQEFLDYLADWRFNGDVVALPEGCVCFSNEPILEVTAPIIDAQLVESFIVNAIHLQTLIATKAARCVHAAEGRTLVDFALRRTHGTDAAMKVARASYLVGFGSTSNVLAGQVYDIPTAGTMAHSYICCFPEEIEAFRAYAASYPEQTILLIDTYDTLQGARHAATVGLEMAQRGHQLNGVRLDSGDMIALSHQVRRILDAAGLPEVPIVASSGFDEYSIAQAVQQGACIDMFGVGTKMGVSAQAPYFDMAYKLVRYDDRPIMKLSVGKATLVEEKQLWRRKQHGYYVEDIIACRDENLNYPEAERLLSQVMRGGRVVRELPTLQAAREWHSECMRFIPASCRQLDNPTTYRVRLSPGLASLQAAVKARLQRQISRG
jgi:nicotinate phosphoribosyltransferase